MRIVIIGNGLSSQIFMKCMKMKCADKIKFIVIEKNSLQENRNIDDVPFYFNRILKYYQDRFLCITVSMGIYHNGKMYHRGNDEIAKKYSFKIIGEETENTVKFIEPEKKVYTFMDNQGYMGRKMSLYNTIYMENQNCEYIHDSEVFYINLGDKKIYYNTKGEINVIDYDFCISTIPLSELNRITCSFSYYRACLKAHPIHMVRCHLENDNKYKVVYCTDEDIRFSRIAKLNDYIYFESSRNFCLDFLNQNENQLICSCFGNISLKNNESYTIYPGRFKQIEDSISEDIVTTYRDCYIFLLGRMANWKFKLVEDLFDDSEAICDYILAKN